MATISISDAAEKLAGVVEASKPSMLAEFYSELFPDRPVPPRPDAEELARHVRHDLAPEEVVDLWNVAFPSDRNVWYDEETETIRYNEELVGYAD